MYYSRKHLEYLGEPIGCAADIIGGSKKYGGGKDGGDAPDYTALAQASTEAARIGAELGEKQLAEAQRQYDINRSVTTPVAAAQLGLMNQTQAQGDDYFNYMKSYSRPVEQSLFYEAMGFTPDEISQIEDSRAGETATFKQNQQTQAQQTIPTTFNVPTFTTEKDIPAGAIKGSDISGFIRQPQGSFQSNVGMGFGSQIPILVTTKPNPDNYYIKNRDGTYSVVGVKDKIVEGSKTVTVNAPNNTAISSIVETPGTDSLVARLGAQAAERKKAQDAAGRAEITGLNTRLATRIGESDVDVYLRNKANIDAETDAAVADSRAGYTNASNNLIRQGLRYGMSPERIAAATSVNNTEQATRQAAAANLTRKSATQTMYQRGIGETGQLLTGGMTDRSNKIQDESIANAKKLDVAGLYRGLPGASQGAYGLSLNAGNSAAQNTATPGNNLMQATQGAAQTIMSGQQAKIGGLSNVLSAQTSANNNNDDSGIWGALGSLGGAAISKMMPAWSDENVKKDIKTVNNAAILEGIKKTDVKRWKYDKNKVDGQDDQEHIGAMAQDLKKNLGEEVSDGKMVDIISAIGVTMAATKELAKKIDKLEGKKK